MAAGTAAAPSRNSRDRHGTVCAGEGAINGTGGVVADGGADGGVPRRGRTLWTAARARVPEAVAIGLPARGLEGGDWPWRRHDDGIVAGGVAWPAGHCRLSGRLEPAGLDRRAVARTTELSLESRINRLWPQGSREGQPPAINAAQRFMLVQQNRTLWHRTTRSSAGI